MKSYLTKLAVLVFALALVVALLPTPTEAQDGGDFRPTFELEGPATEGVLAGVDPTGVEFEWWHQHGGSREERLTELVTEFNENNPWGITVNASNQGGYGDIYQKVIAGLTTGELPTLVVAYQNQALAYQAGDGIFDMSVFVENPTWGLNEAEAADYIGSFFNQDFAADGTRIGFPPNRSIEVLYYNMDALEELGYDAPPSNWEEFREMSCRFTEEGWSGYDGETLGYMIRTDASNIAAMTYGFGEDIYTDGEFNYNNPATVEALSFMQSLLEDGCAGLIPERFEDQNRFAAGGNLFYVGSSSGLPFIQAAVNESENPINWGVAYLPYTEVPAVDVYGASVSILQGENITTEQQLAAWLFVRWFTEPAQQARWAEASNYFPVRISTTDELGNVFAEIPQYEQAWNLLLNGESKTEPAVSGYDVIRDEAEAAFNTILAEGADVETTLEALDARAAEIQAEFEAPME
ncbi:MAG: extracellular solute-binding protein [Chloroflexi bacterium]|nr:extracellular solute-binding protein [Chloroflexota bacterium]